MQLDAVRFPSLCLRDFVLAPLATTGNKLNAKSGARVGITLWASLHCV